MPASRTAYIVWILIEINQVDDAARYLLTLSQAWPAQITSGLVMTAIVSAIAEE
jgi:hypothetical protein